MRLSQYRTGAVGIACAFLGLIVGALASTSGNAQVIASCDPSPSPVVSDSPSPTPSPTVAGPPAYPNATSTGVPAGTVLTVFNGNMTINTAGAVVENKDIRGCVVITAPNVTLKNSKVTCTNGYGVDVQLFSDLKGAPRPYIQDTEITCGDGPGTGLGEINFIAIRLNIHGCENGADVDSDADIRDSFIHDIYNGGGAHADGIQSQVGHNLNFVHNTILSADPNKQLGTSAIIVPPTGTVKILIQDNLVAGGAYTIYCQRPTSGSENSVIDNKFSTMYSSKIGAYGPDDDCADEAHVSGNVYYDGPNAGKLITLS